jgi:MFS transporter, DHA1 family, multidrug resistance protein
MHVHDNVGSSTSSAPTDQSGISTREFTILVAFMMSITAISIDAILPALGAISQDIHLVHANQAQYILSAVFLGMALGQLICGPLSDAIGRKKILYAGISLFLCGSVVCFLAQDIETILIGRFLQGLGVAGPYVSAISIVRDKFSGREMAKIMSFVMLIFITVPALAPSLGQAILFLASWRYIFVLYIFYSVAIGLWIFLRLEETLPAENRIPFTVRGFVNGFKEVISNRVTMSFTVCMGLLFGGFVGYLNSSQQIFQVMFNTGKMFTVYFGVLAALFGAASLVNSQLVEKWGMHYISKRAIIGIILSSVLFLGLHRVADIQLWMFMLYASAIFFCFGLVFGNINALAMEPMGHVAGIASAIIGSVSSILSMIIGTSIGQMFNNTVVPVTTGFLIMSSLAMMVMQFANSKKP